MGPYFVTRVDLDYVPWDTPDAQEFGHGEPAVVLRLLDMADHIGSPLQFFASVRFLRAFPSLVSAIGEAGHPIDWLCKHPTNPKRQEEAILEFQSFGLSPYGLATRNAWPESEGIEPASTFHFLSAPIGSSPNSLVHFELNTKPDREAARSGTSARNWAEKIKLTMRDCASRRQGATICVRPQVLSHFDPKLHVLRELIEFAPAIGLPRKTFQAFLLEHRKK